MKIKPRFDTSDISFENASAEINVSRIESPRYKDPQGVISSGIYKVFRFEKVLYIFNIVFLSFLLIASGLIVLGLWFNFFTRFGTEYTTKWTWYILPTLVFVGAITKLSLVLIEAISLSRTLKYYRQSVNKDEKYTPSFIVRLYKRIILRQVHHNWLTIFLVFYGSIFTLSFWFLRDQVWFWGWINFKEIISAFLWGPKVMTTLFAAFLISIVLLQIILMILRRKRLTDIETFFGHQVIAESQINIIKSKRNKVLFRLFIGSIFVILIIPALALWIAKRFIKRK